MCMKLKIYIFRAVLFLIGERGFVLALCNFCTQIISVQNKLVCGCLDYEEFRQTSFGKFCLTKCLLLITNLIYRIPNLSSFSAYEEKAFILFLFFCCQYLFIQLYLILNRLYHTDKRCKLNVLLCFPFLFFCLPFLLK